MNNLVKETLKLRASKLARPLAKTKDETLFTSLVEFTLGREHYAVETEFLREICPLTDFLKLPSVPAFIFGVFNLRGEIISIIDLKKVFEIPDGGLSDMNKVLILRQGEREFGLLADTVLGIRKMPLEGTLDTLPTLIGVRRSYLKGVTQDHLIILDASKLLSDKKLVIGRENHENEERDS